MRVLFICNQNKHRSKTAEELFKDRFETKSAGLYNNQVHLEQLQWADIVVVMDDEQRIELSRRFPKQYLQKRIVTLNIPDSYAYNQPELKAHLERNAHELLEPFVENEHS